MAAEGVRMQRGVVKQALSGDTVIVRGQPKGGPPPERTICLSNILAPRLARRPNPNVEGSVATPDEPCAWEAREYLRTRLIGRDITFTVEYAAPGTSREYGAVFFKKDGEMVNMTEQLLSEGLAEVRRGGISPTSESQQKLIELEDAAKSAKKGKWDPEASKKYVRDLKWSLEESTAHFVDSLRQEPQTAVIEQVRDACTVRAFLIPSFQYVTVMLAGIKAPMFARPETEGAEPKPELFAGEAKYFVESRLLQREVKIVLEGTPGSQSPNILGSVLHPNGNIAELLLREGFARCVDWSMGVVTQGSDKLRAAEKAAKAARLRIWKDYTPNAASTIPASEKSYQGKVTEVLNGDGLVVRTANGLKKVFLASVRPPRQSDQAKQQQQAEGEGGEAPAPPKPVAQKPPTRSRPLYDVPYLFEAREFLRKKLIGKKVSVEVDYIQPASGGFQEKVCCTVSVGGVNVGEALVSKGLATAIRYRMDDDQRAAGYDALLLAEERAKKKGAGLHSKREPPIHRVADIAGDVPKAKQFLPFLTRAGRSDAVVEFCSSGSRFRLYVPKETCLITFLLSGISCPRASRPGGPAGGVVPSDPFGEEAAAFVKEMCLQREVQVQVEALDKGGNFIGWMFCGEENVSQCLVAEGLAKVHFTAERSQYFGALKAAEDRARADSKNVWKDYVEPKAEAVEEEEEEGDDKQEDRKADYKEVVATEVSADLHFFAQSIENGPQLEGLMDQLRGELTANAPTPGAYTPHKNDLCVARFSDGQWYRARVESVKGNQASLLYIDYGNRETTAVTNLATLPQSFTALPPQATEYCLACVTLPPDEESREDCQSAFAETLTSGPILVRPEYRGERVGCVSVLEKESRDDVGKGLVRDGLAVAEQRRERRLQKLVAEYKEAETQAKKERLNIWRYGDFQEDEAREFGFQQRQ